MSFTKEKLPWCPCPFKHEAYMPGLGPISYSCCAGKYLLSKKFLPWSKHYQPNFHLLHIARQWYSAVDYLCWKSCGNLVGNTVFYQWRNFMLSKLVCAYQLYEIGPWCNTCNTCSIFFFHLLDLALSMAIERKWLDMIQWWFMMMMINAVKDDNIKWLIPHGMCDWNPILSISHVISSWLVFALGRFMLAFR